MTETTNFCKYLHIYISYIYFIYFILVLYKTSSKEDGAILIVCIYGFIVTPQHRPASSRVRVTSDHVTVTTLLCFRCFISDVSCRHARLRDRSGDKSKAGDGMMIMMVMLIMIMMMIAWLHNLGPGATGLGSRSCGLWQHCTDARGQQCSNC